MMKCQRVCLKMWTNWLDSTTSAHWFLSLLCTCSLYLYYPNTASKWYFNFVYCLSLVMGLHLIMGNTSVFHLYQFFLFYPFLSFCQALKKPKNNLCHQRLFVFQCTPPAFPDLCLLCVIKGLFNRSVSCACVLFPVFALCSRNSWAQPCW